MSLKKRGIALLQHKSIRKVTGDLSVSYIVVRNWKRVSDKIDKFKCNKKSTNLRGVGRPPVLPEPDALLHAKRTITDLERTRAEFAVSFHAKHATTADDCVYKVDETGIQYDMPPRYTWSKKGGTPKLSKGEKHSYRMTAVLMYACFRQTQLPTANLSMSRSWLLSSAICVTCV
ncbi:hypothetical protein DYB37_013701 [Aphanomyces astaci]|uniref:DDE-1 domain-containing protein n=1 Tax=Aphanomyces astaci TaxID=112090 RepID=A0A3L6VLX1_APHAT|nr:hypothetical protein DYB37_013701 [Aphanomyces astaci]RLO09639.1 hypothetical protein DYB28_007686 [Aphanomyces astaci]